MHRYRERLMPPLGWYLVAAAIVATLMIAALFSVGPQVSTVIGLLGAVVTGTVFARQATAIRVDADGALWVGRAHLEPRYRGSVTALDAARTRALMRRDGDPRAWLVTRPYLPTAVRIDIDDPADPHPYWLVASRTPRRLAQALREPPENLRQEQ